MIDVDLITELLHTCDWRIYHDDHKQEYIMDFVKRGTIIMHQIIVKDVDVVEADSAIIKLMISAMHGMRLNDRKGPMVQTMWFNR